ncbi:hypothetical protein RIF29_38744 [Crotalaria pallida]|uniref:Uncharacterized protein n=1 Tax=Crotalaria pallida TaxID=3830 RepID=A0AAN9HP82_CROPI
MRSSSSQTIVHFTSPKDIEFFHLLVGFLFCSAEVVQSEDQYHVILHLQFREIVVVSSILWSMLMCVSPLSSYQFVSAYFPNHFEAPNTLLSHSRAQTLVDHSQVLRFNTFFQSVVDWCIHCIAYLYLSREELAPLPLMEAFHFEQLECRHQRVVSNNLLHECRFLSCSVTIGCAVELSSATKQTYV